MLCYQTAPELAILMYKYLLYKQAIHRRLSTKTTGRNLQKPQHDKGPAQPTLPGVSDRRPARGTRGHQRPPLHRAQGPGV